MVMNRQPTLQQPPMMGFGWYPKSSKHSRYLAVTKPLNADFDGDGINCHVAQNSIAAAEVKELMATPFNIPSPKNGMPIICIVQDVTVSMYLLTKRKSRLKDRCSCNIWWI